MASLPAKTLVLMQLSLLLLSSVLADEVEHSGWAHSLLSLPSISPAEAPKPHKGHHHHHHPHPPTHPPVHPPVKPPTHPPVKPPVHPPVKPPVHPPVKPPTKPPVHPPVKPPVHPPVKPPTKPPVYPPVKPPVHPPVKPPVHPPVKPPTKPPVHPPVKPPVRKLVAVQGVVYCKDCKYAGIDTLMGAKPLVGAVVRLQCNNSKYKPVVAESTTDKNGYFLILPQKVTTAGSHKCRVFLAKSPSMKCDVPTNFKAGLKGAILMPSLKPPASNPLGPSYELFTVGPFAYEPSKKLPCPR